MKWWDNYLKRKYKKIREQEEKEEQARLEEEERIKEEARKEHAAKMKKSNEPWFDITSTGHVPELGLRLVTDWNDAMIKYLKANGFTGATDEDIIYSYFRAVSQDVERREHTDDFGDVLDNDVPEDENV